MSERKGQFETERLEQRVLLAQIIATDIGPPVGLLGESVITASGDIGGLDVSAITSSGYTALSRAATGIPNVKMTSVATGGLLFIAATETGASSGLWRTDGTPAGTYQLAADRSLATLLGFARSIQDGRTLENARFAIVGNRLFFANYNASGASELWVSDGSEKGTYEIDLVPGDDRSEPNTFVGGSSLTYFFANTEESRWPALWRSDGTAGGTFALQTATAVLAMATVGDTLYFVLRSDTTGDTELWSTEGTKQSTRLLGALGPARSDAAISPIEGGAIVRTGNDLWKIIGANGKPTLLRHFTDGFLDENWTTGGRVYFNFLEGKTWSSDGTKAGTTVQVWSSDLTPGLDTFYRTLWREELPSAPGQYLRFGFFRADPGQLPSKAFFRGDGESTTWVNLGIEPVGSITPVGMSGNHLYLYTQRSGQIDLYRADTTAGSISGSIFADANHNGSKDSSESGLSGWRVFVDLNGDGVCNTKEPQTRTSSSGYYQIGDLPAGKYTVRATRVAGYAATTNESYRVTVEALGNVTKRFGFAPAGIVRGYVYNDLNQNGIQNIGELGRKDFRVWIDLDNDGVLDDNEPTAKTNSAGRYTIADVLPGDYRIRLKPRGGWISTTPKAYSFSLSAGSTSSKKFGVVQI